MADATYSIGLVVEAPDDGRTTTTLIDRCLLEGIEWLEPEHLEHLRAWRGIEPSTELTVWKQVTTLARAHRVLPMGFFDGNPGEHDARMARRVLLLFAKLGMPDLVVLVHDADDRPDRRRGFEQARNGTPFPERIVVGIANPEREAWIIAGFVSCDEREQSALARSASAWASIPRSIPMSCGETESAAPRPRSRASSAAICTGSSVA